MNAPAAVDRAAAAAVQSPAKRFSSSPQIWAACISIGVAIPLGLLAYALGRPAYWILLYVGVALLTGLLFWTFTPGGTATADLKQIGIRLTGGAAVGLAFMLVAAWLTPTPSVMIVELPERFTAYHRPDPEPSASIDVVRMSEHELVARFRSGADEGRFYLSFTVPGELEPRRECFVLRRGDPKLRGCDEG